MNRPLYSFDSPLVEAKLIRRYKRFLADVVLPNGEEVTVHCPNPGRMTSILEEVGPVYLTDLRDRPNPKRKLDFRWELSRVGTTLVVVNTQLANKVARAAFSNWPEARGRLGAPEDALLMQEVTLAGEEGTSTRFDFAFATGDRPPLYVEVKQVTLRVSDSGNRRWAAFPDAVTARGTRHLRELTRLARAGSRTSLFYVVGRDDVDAVRPAREVDPVYSDAYLEAVAAGVRIIACRLRACKTGLYFDSWLPVFARS